jgi:hypothetical protein
MKLVTVALVGIFALGTAQAVETKKVCVKQLDAKTKKEKEVCKTIKIHKKLDVKDQKK